MCDCCGKDSRSIDTEMDEMKEEKTEMHSPEQNTMLRLTLTIGVQCNYFIRH